MESFINQVKIRIVHGPYMRPLLFESSQPAIMMALHQLTHMAHPALSKTKQTSAPHPHPHVERIVGGSYGCLGQGQQTGSLGLQIAQSRSSLRTLGPQRIYCVYIYIIHAFICIYTWSSRGWTAGVVQASLPWTCGVRRVRRSLFETSTWVLLSR